MSRVRTATGATPVNQTSAVHVIRRRRVSGRTPADEGKEGKVVTLKEEEGYVQKLLRAVRPNISTFRHGEYLHVSDLIGKCQRRVALQTKYSLPGADSVHSESMAITFAQGVAIHDYVKGRFQKGHKDKLFGKWACLCGATTTLPMLAADIPKQPCKECRTVPHRYMELDLRDRDLKIVGSPDITLFLSQQQAYLPVEVKSITANDWPTLARPKPDHVIQVLFYWHLLREEGHSVTDVAKILYVCKGALFKGSPYKEFSVAADERVEELAPYMEEARVLRRYREGDGPLPERTCSNPTCSAAKNCNATTVCFSL